MAVGTGLATRALGRRAEPQQAECLTGDRNLILVSAIVHYEIADPKAYLINVADVPTLVRNVAASALAPVISSMRVDAVLTVEAQGEADRFEKVRAELAGHNSETGLVSRDGPRGASDELDRSRFWLTENA